MLSEEKQAVENLEKLVKLRKNIRGEITHDTCICGTLDLDTALNLITKLQKEVKEQKHKKTYARQNIIYKNKQLGQLRKNIKKLKKEKEEKDKQIDLMGEVIFKKFAAQLVLEYGIENKEQFIKLFEERAKEKGE